MVLFRLVSCCILALASASARAQAPDGGRLATLQDAVKKTVATAEPAVVAIVCRPQGDGTRAGDDPLAGAVQCGTGVVIDARGLILTNYHLLGDVKRSQYEVWLSERRRAPAHIKAADPYSDLAVLEISVDQLKAVELGDANTLYKGQFVLALGNPYAIIKDGSASACWGIVSNVRANPGGGDDRQAADDERSADSLYRYGSLIESDASLRLATSGGPLLTLDGKMIGLVTSTAVLAGYDAQATYSIPMDAGIRRVVDQLKDGREPEFGFIGVQVDEVARDEQAEPTVGVRVANVVNGTPAARARIRVGDHVTRVGDQSIRNPDEFLRQIGLRSPGESVILLVRRPDTFLGRSRQSRVELSLAKKYVRLSRPRVVTHEQPVWRGLAVDYSTAIPDLLQRAEQIDSEGCVAVMDVRAESAAWDAGIKKGMFITHVNETRITTPAQFHTITQPIDVAVSLRVVSHDGSQDLIVRSTTAH